MRCVCCGGEVTFFKTLAGSVGEGLCDMHARRWMAEHGPLADELDEAGLRAEALAYWRRFTVQQARAH